MLVLLVHAIDPLTCEAGRQSPPDLPKSFGEMSPLLGMTWPNGREVTLVDDIEVVTNPVPLDPTPFDLVLNVPNRNFILFRNLFSC